MFKEAIFFNFPTENCTKKRLEVNKYSVFENPSFTFNNFLNEIIIVTFKFTMKI